MKTFIFDDCSEINPRKDTIIRMGGMSSNYFVPTNLNLLRSIYDFLCRRTETNKKKSWKTPLKYSDKKNIFNLFIKLLKLRNYFPDIMTCFFIVYDLKLPKFYRKIRVPFWEIQQKLDILSICRIIEGIRGKTFETTLLFVNLSIALPL